jgi:hypothetical protein
MEDRRAAFPKLFPFPKSTRAWRPAVGLPEGSTPHDGVFLRTSRCVQDADHVAVRRIINAADSESGDFLVLSIVDRDHRVAKRVPSPTVF